MNFTNYLLGISIDANNLFKVELFILVIIFLLVVFLIVMQIRQAKSLKNTKENEILEYVMGSHEDNEVEESKVEDSLEDKVSNELESVENNKEEEPPLIQLSDLPIPDKLDYTQSLWENDYIELQNISKELENNNTEKRINMTSFEQEQEDKAIISYDELVQNRDNSSINYIDVDKEVNEITIKQVDLEKTGQLELDPVKKAVNTAINTKVGINEYEHEEAFLNTLKQLKDLLG